jgi:membrane-associated protease RseP (regulator of RpoE activity)
MFATKWKVKSSNSKEAHQLARISPQRQVFDQFWRMFTMTTRTTRLKHLTTFLLFAIFVLFLLPTCGRQHPRAFERQSDDGWIGVYLQDLDEELRDYLDVRNGVMVNSVVEDSPAMDAGLRDEDVIVKFDGRRVRESSDLVRAVRRKRPGDRVDVEVLRDGERKELRLRIGERRRSFAAAPRPEPDAQPYVYRFSDNRRAMLGVRTAELNQDLAQYFDADAGEGVLILSVEEGSPADDAGLRGGDVILEIDGDAVESPAQLADVIGSRRAGDEVEIQFKRRGRKRSTTAQLEATSQNSNFNFNLNLDPQVRDNLRNNLRRNLDLRGFRDQIRDLRDRIRTEVRENIRRDARQIRHKIVVPELDLHIEMDPMLHNLHENINEHIHESIQAEIDAGMHCDMSRLEEHCQMNNRDATVKVDHGSI